MTRKNHSKQQGFARVMVEHLATRHWQTIVLVTLLLLIQWPLWFGKGGWLRVNELERQLGAQRLTNAKLTARNQALAGEVNDLKTGLAAIEERARYELDLIQPNEIFVSLGAGSEGKRSVPATAPARGR